MPSRSDLVALLTDLYAEQLRHTPGDPYTIAHAHPEVIDTQVSVFEWYLRYLRPEDPPTLHTPLRLAENPHGEFAHVLDWGCRHAPDACLFRATCGHAIYLYATDISDPAPFAPFHQSAVPQYARLDHVYRLPYPDETFDIVIGSGTLEHVAMDYESLKEIYRVLRVGGRFVITYLPNRWSYEEWWKRDVRKDGAHPRLYSRRELRHVLLHHGFRIVTDGYQTRYDRLGGASAWKRLPVRFSQLHRFTSTLCAVAEKVHYMN